MVLCHELVNRLKDMIESGRLQAGNVPEDFAWLERQIEQLSEPKDAEDEKAISRAEEIYCNDDVEIDPDCFLSHADGGLWVSAWVWVPDETPEAEYAA
jgi:hypothetical protein